MNFKKSGAILLILLAGLYGTFFGVGTLTNLHNAYLRTLSQWTVLIHNSHGSGATGFLVKGKSGKKYIMTNGHVCGLQEDGKVFVYYGGDEYRLRVIKMYEDNDLCAIEAPNTAGNTAKVARSFSIGESAYAIGHPLLEPKSITLGELSGPVDISVMVAQNVLKEQCTGPTYEFIDLGDNPLAAMMGLLNVCIRHLTAEASTAVILPGNSGSAVVNIYGNVIGVAFAANEYGTRSYIVPLSNLKEFLGEL